MKRSIETKAAVVLASAVTALSPAVAHAEKQSAAEVRTARTAEGMTYLAKTIINAHMEAGEVHDTKGGHGQKLRTVNIFNTTTGVDGNTVERTDFSVTAPVSKAGNLVLRQVQAVSVAQSEGKALDYALSLSHDTHDGITFNGYYGGEESVNLQAATAPASSKQAVLSESRTETVIESMASAIDGGIHSQPVTELGQAFVQPRGTVIGQ